MSALITTANSPKALTVVRSLGRKGIAIDTADKQKFALSSLSKYSKNFFQYPSPARTPNEFISELTRLLTKRRYDVLIPVHSEDTYIIAKYKSLLEKFTRIPLHDYSSIMQVNDKGFLAGTAKLLNIPIPETHQIDEFSDLYHIVDRIDYPVVIKLRKSSSSIGISYAHSKEELIVKFKETVSRYNLSSNNFPLIQEYIEGDGCGVSLLFNHGNLRAKFSHKRLREYPISGGPATYRISIKHSGMEKMATELLEYYNWHGVAMVEFKMDQKQNPVLIEVNPRFWGSINQAVQSGIDFPYLLYKMAIEGDIPTNFHYEVGVKTRNIFTDYLSIYHHMRAEKNIRYLREYLSGPINDDIISISDPVPIIGFLKEGLKEIIHSRYN